MTRPSKSASTARSASSPAKSAGRSSMTWRAVGQRLGPRGSGAPAWRAGRPGRGWRATRPSRARRSTMRHMRGGSTRWRRAISAWVSPSSPLSDAARPGGRRDADDAQLGVGGRAQQAAGDGQAVGQPVVERGGGRGRGGHGGTIVSPLTIRKLPIGPGGTSRVRRGAHPPARGGEVASGPPGRGAYGACRRRRAAAPPSRGGTPRPPPRRATRAAHGRPGRSRAGSRRSGGCWWK